MSLPSRSVVLLAVVAALALTLGAGAMASTTASAVGVNIDPSSCGGSGNPNCTSLPANVTIGANSCTVASACDGLQDGVVIGAGSCNGNNACDLSGGSIGDDSCNASLACVKSGYEGNGSVGDSSCNDFSACEQNGFEGTGSVGDSSCSGNGACYENGYEGSGSVGDNSCNGTLACRRNGANGAGTIGNYSCNDASACYNNGYLDTNTCSLGTPGVVSECGLIDSGVLIGNLSCNQTGQYNANCQYSHDDVGNCMYNDETPVLCTQGTIQVEKVVVGNSNDRFDLKVDGVVQAYHVGDGGTTDPVAVDPGWHFVGESAVAPASLNDYDARVTCEAYNAIAGTDQHPIVPRTRGAATFSVAAGDVVTCTITNTKLTSSWWHRTR